MKKIIIKPITELRNTTGISELCHQLGQPIFITRNGANDLVVMADEVYQATASRPQEKTVSDPHEPRQCSLTNFPRCGFLRVAARVNRVRVADITYNCEQIIAELEKARACGEQIVVFPELSLTGYSCGDLFFQEALLEAVQEALERLKEYSRLNPLFFAVGAPLLVGSNLYNCAVVFSGGRILGAVPKSYLPNYREYYEKRHFSSGLDLDIPVEIAGDTCRLSPKQLFAPTSFPAAKIAIEICEDLWVPSTPSTEAALSGANIILNLSASNEVAGKDRVRERLVAATSARLRCAYVYASAGRGESSQDLVYSGAALIAENGEILAANKILSSDPICADIDVELLEHERLCESSFKAPNTAFRAIDFNLTETLDDLRRPLSSAPFISGFEDTVGQIVDLQVQALATRLEKLGNCPLVLGLSGGLDSTLALLVACETMKRTNRSNREIYAFSLPAFGTTTRTKNNAETLAAKLDVSFKEIDLTETIKSHISDIELSENDHSVAYENAQARERTQFLMDTANKLGAIVLGTGDLSEAALGWSTYNGDHMSNYSINCSIPKTFIRLIIQQYSLKHSDLSKVLDDILATPVSPELLPNENDKIVQETESIVGPYILHDFFIFYCLRYNFSPKKIFFLACQAFKGEYTKKQILKWEKVFYKRFFSQQFKRSCSPDGPKVTLISLSPRGDWRMPSDAYATLFLDELERIIIDD